MLVLEQNVTTSWHLNCSAAFGTSKAGSEPTAWLAAPCSSLIIVPLFVAVQCAVPVVLMAKGDIKKFFQGWSPVLTEHIFSQVTVLSYILFWMIFYNLCHVF